MASPPGEGAGSGTSAGNGGANTGGGSTRPGPGPDGETTEVPEEEETSSLLAWLPLLLLGLGADMEDLGPVVTLDRVDIHPHHHLLAAV